MYYFRAKDINNINYFIRVSDPKLQEKKNCNHIQVHVSIPKKFILKNIWKEILVQKICAFVEDTTVEIKELGKEL